MSTVTVKPEEVGMSSAGLENVTRLVRRCVDQGRYAGTVSVVARRGGVVHFEANGSMDVERGQAMRPDTIFRIYSMTKPIVSVGLMLLYEQGLFQLNDPVRLRRSPLPLARKPGAVPTTHPRLPTPTGGLRRAGG